MYSLQKTYNEMQSLQAFSGKHFHCKEASRAMMALRARAYQEIQEKCIIVRYLERFLQNTCKQSIFPNHGCFADCAL